jgi:hypothetical protein
MKDINVKDAPDVAGGAVPLPPCFPDPFVDPPTEPVDPTKDPFQPWTDPAQQS